MTIAVVRRGRGRPPGQARKRVLQEILPPQEMLEVDGVTAPIEPVRYSKTGVRLLNSQEKTIVQVCALASCTLRETAAFLKIHEHTFHNILKRKDPEDGVSYRELWERWSADCGGSLKRRMWRQSNIDDSAGGQMKQFLAKNILGWSDKKTETVHHTGTITHEHIPKNLEVLTTKELEDMASDATVGKPVMRH